MTKRTKVDAYQEVTDQLIAALESGTVPWSRPWRTAGPVRNAVSDKPYRGINAVLLGYATLAAGYTDSRWLTYRQARSLGGHVRRGEKGRRIVFWRMIDAKGGDDHEDSDGERKRKIPLARTYVVFNVEQCEDLELLKPLQLDDSTIAADEQCEAIVAGYLAGGPTLEHRGERASYNPRTDTVRMPPRQRFESSAAYYSVLFHELTHSTGHRSRLDRGLCTDFGSDSYSREELTAEIGAAMLCGAAGIDSETTVQRSVAYLRSWIDALRGDKRLAVTAAARAQKAVDFILDSEAAAAAA